MKPGETGYFSIGFSTDSKSAPLGRGYTAVAEGTEQERLVDELYILLYKTDGTLETRIEVDVTNNDGTGGLINFEGSDISGTSPASKKQVKTKAYPVTAQKYSMVVIANPTTALKAMTDKNNISELKTLTEIKAIATELGTIPFNETSIDGDLRFLMSNSREEVVVEITDLKSTAQLAEASPVSVGLDRTVAKLEVLQTADFITNMNKFKSDGKIQDWQNLSWDVDVINKKSFWMRHKSVNKAQTAETSANVREDLYAEDPNMGEITADYSLNFTALTIDNTYLGTTGKEVALAASAVAVYVPENTFEAAMQAADKWGTQSTHVVVKVQIIPANHDIGATEWTKGYYSYDGFVFTHAEAKGWINDGAAPSSAKITVAQLKSSTIFWDNNDIVDNAPTEYTTETIDGKTLVFHFESWNVYRIPIKHFDFSPVERSKKGHYGVVRNNWYRVSINSISGPGDGSSEKYISADVEILDWLQRDQEEDL